MKCMPAFFFGHGNPLNTLYRNEWTEGWEKISQTIPRPKGILAISAHWYVPGTAVTVMDQPRTIHDFGGFPAELYAINYPAPGDPVLAARVRELTAPSLSLRDDAEWGLDHGTWMVIRHIFPEADVPVIQMSIDSTKPPRWHYALGKMLAPLREEEILVVGSGNVVHNLHSYSWGDHPVDPFDWAVRFDGKVRESISTGNEESLVEYPRLGRDAILSVPTPDHYLPLLYILGLKREEDEVLFPVEGYDGGSISMLSVRIG